MSEDALKHELFPLNGTEEDATPYSDLDLASSSFDLGPDAIPSLSVWYRPNWQTLRNSFIGLIKSFFYAFVPQFIRTRWFNDNPQNTTRLNSISWINGIRGIAALIVIGYHYLYAFQYDILLGLWTQPNRRIYFYQIPPIPILIDGTVAVQMFFTIAGFVCSYTTLNNSTKQDHQALFQSLPASVFRRFFRLYLPPIASLFCISMLAYCGAYDHTRHYFAPAVRKQYFPGLMGELHPQRYPTLIVQLQQLWKQIHAMGNIWIEKDSSPVLDWHLWTIVREFQGSMHLYIALVGLARCKPYARIFWLGLIGYVEAFQWPHQDILPFFAGAIIAQLDVLRKQPGNMEPTNKRSKHLRWLSRAFALVRTPIRIIAYMLALYLMSSPYKEWDEPSFLYWWMKPWIPSTYLPGHAHIFPRQLGCITLVYLLSTVPEEDRARSLWHRLCTSSIPLYLGSIMFGLYLTHTMVLHLFGYILPLWIWAVIGGNADNWRYCGGLLAAYLVNVTLCLWVADVWTREVEGRLMRLVRWLENLCFEEM